MPCYLLNAKQLYEPMLFCHIFILEIGLKIGNIKNFAVLKIPMYFMQTTTNPCIQGSGVVYSLFSQEPGDKPAEEKFRCGA